MADLAVPAGSGTTSNSTSAATQSQQPSTEPNPLDNLTHADLRKKLDTSRKELRSFLDRKKRIDRELATLEASIHAFEGSYLSDSLLPPSTAQGNANAQFGNIIKGYDSYLKAAASGSDRKRGRPTEEARDQDRMFSRSSATFQKALDLRNMEVVESASEEESVATGGGASGTPGGGGGASSSSRKKRRDR